MTVPRACIEPIVQKKEGDCAIAALAMLSGLPYRLVSEVAIKISPNVHDVGLWTTQIMAIAKALQFPLVKRRVTSVDLDDATGLVTMYQADEQHCVVLFEGVMINPGDGMIWNFETYLTHRGWTVNGFLEPRDGK